MVLIVGPPPPPPVTSFKALTCISRPTPVPFPHHHQAARNAERGGVAERDAAAGLELRVPHVEAAEPGPPITGDGQVRPRSSRGASSSLLLHKVVTMLLRFCWWCFVGYADRLSGVRYSFVLGFTGARALQESVLKLRFTSLQSISCAPYDNRGHTAPLAHPRLSFLQMVAFHTSI